jgi:hypothetical protein
VPGLLRTPRWVRGNSQGSQRAARENLKIADIGPRAPRVVRLPRVYSPPEIWPGKTIGWPSGKTRLLEQTLAMLNRSGGRPCSPGRPHSDHLRATVPTVVLGVVHETIPAIRMPVNPERRVSDTTSDTLRMQPAR